MKQNPPHSDPPTAIEERPPLEPEITDRTIEALAVKAFLYLSRLSPQEAIQAWATWKRELERRLPAYAAAEVYRRAEELQDLAR